MQAFAELNILLGRCLSSGAITDQQLLAFSCFTPVSRAQLWQRYSSYAASKAALSEHQMQLLRFLLETVLAP